MKEWRVVWVKDDGKEEFVTLDCDYHPLTEQQALDSAESRQRHSEVLRIANVRAEWREVIVTKWERA